MELSARTKRQILLLSLVVLIIPLVLFPGLYGTRLMEPAIVNVIYEVGLYAIVAIFATRRTSFLSVFQATGLCLFYRLMLGTAFGFLVWVAYPNKIIVALTWGLASYLPAVVLHILATPIVLLPALRSLGGEPRRREHPRYELRDRQELSRRPDPSPAPRTAPLAKAPSAPDEPAERAYQPPRPAPRVPQPQGVASVMDGNGFDRAARYIGEDGSVLMAAVVNHEGLLLGHFKRGHVDPESWAPFAPVLLEANAAGARKIGFDRPEKMDMLFDDRRLVIAGDQNFTLMVVSERALEDVLNIRINQALDLIRKTFTERYASELVGNVEKSHVRSA